MPRSSSRYTAVSIEQRMRRHWCGADFACSQGTIIRSASNYSSTSSLTCRCSKRSRRLVEVMVFWK